jgi:hypothetical protein
MRRNLLVALCIFGGGTVTTDHLRPPWPGAQLTAKAGSRMTTANGVDVNGFWENGWTIVRGLYSRDDVARLREAAFWSRKNATGDLLSNPRLREVLTDGKFVGIARQLLGEDKIVYGGDSAFTVNGTQRGFHKDNADRVDPGAPDWQGRYTILRFGVYLQDHYRHTGGLNLRHQSHNTPDLGVGENVYVRTRVGDVAVWSLRTTHSGNGTLLRFPKSKAPLPSQADKYPEVGGRVEGRGPDRVVRRSRPRRRPHGPVRRVPEDAQVHVRDLGALALRPGGAGRGRTGRADGAQPAGRDPGRPGGRQERRLRAAAVLTSRPCRHHRPAADPRRWPASGAGQRPVATGREGSVIHSDQDPT